MEPSIIFAGSVGFVCAFDLLSTVINKMTKSHNVNTAQITGTRSDWYCFFNISDLTGQDDNRVGQREDQNVHEELLEQRRQEESKRPRLYV